MQLKDKIPEKAYSELKKSFQKDEEILYSLRSDLDLKRRFGDSFLVATNKRIAVLDAEDIALIYEFHEISEVRVEELFGSLRILAIKGEAHIVLIYYTKALVPQFGVFCRVINQLIGRRVSATARFGEPELPEEDEKAYCSRCGAPLPERGAPCSLCISRIVVFRRILTLIKPFKYRAILLVLATIIMVLSQMVPPYITKVIVDDVLRARQFEKLNLWIFAMLLCGVIYFISSFFTGITSSWLASKLVSDLRARLHSTIQRLQLNYFSRHSSGELVSKIMHDTGELQHFLLDGMPYLMVNCVSFVVIAIILIKLDVQLAILVFLPVPVLIFGAGFFWRRLVPLFHQQGNIIGKLHSTLGESITGIKVVKAFAQEKRRTGEFNQSSEKLFRIRFDIESTFIGFRQVMFLIMQIGVIAVWFFSARRIIQNDPELTLGDLLAFVGYIWLFYGPMQWFTVILDWMTHAFASAERIFMVLDTPTEVYEAPNAASVPKIQGKISFNDVYFSYERGKEVIKGISFDIAKGEMIGLVGKSGSGKSTIINLICRFFDVDSGAVLIDGYNIKDIRLDQFRLQLGMVMQEPFLFNASIIENICYGNPDACFEDVVRAAKAAHAHEFILDKEDGYDTVIGERGVQLSGGEKQRISIARAILHDPPILILDEATSSVDVETEKNIQDAIGRLVRGRTTIAIAHRLSTLRNAHRLFFIEDGKIAEMGTHDELMAKNANYAELVKIQSKLNRIKHEVWK